MIPENPLLPEQFTPVIDRQVSDDELENMANLVIGKYEDLINRFVIPTCITEVNELVHASTHTGGAKRKRREEKKETKGGGIVKWSVIALLVIMFHEPILAMLAEVFSPTGMLNDFKDGFRDARNIQRGGVKSQSDDGTITEYTNPPTVSAAEMIERLEKRKEDLVKYELAYQKAISEMLLDKEKAHPIYNGAVKGAEAFMSIASSIASGFFLTGQHETVEGIKKGFRVAANPVDELVGQPAVNFKSRVVWGFGWMVGKINNVISGPSVDQVTQQPLGAMDATLDDRLSDNNIIYNTLAVFGNLANSLTEMWNNAMEGHDKTSFIIITIGTFFLIHSLAIPYIKKKTKKLIGNGIDKSRLNDLRKELEGNRTNIKDIDTQIRLIIDAQIKLERMRTTSMWGRLTDGFPIRVPTTFRWGRRKKPLMLEAPMMEAPMLEDGEGEMEDGEGESRLIPYLLKDRKNHDSKSRGRKSKKNKGGKSKKNKGGKSKKNKEGKSKKNKTKKN
jgi:hypothetical protein